MKESNLVVIPEIRARFSNIPWIKILGVLAAILITAMFGVVIGYLIVSGEWIYGAVLLAVLPVLLVLVRYPFIGLLIWLAIMPFLLYTQNSAARQLYWLVHRFLPLGVIIILVLSASFGKNKRNLPKLTVVEYSMGAYVLLTVLSIVLLNNQPSATFIRFYDLIIVPFFLYMIIRLFVPHKHSFQFIILLALYITVTQVAFGILSWVMPSVLPKPWLEYAGVRTTGSLHSVSVYTTTLVFTGLILLNVGLRSEKKWKRYLYIGLFLTTLLATFISYSRASWLAGILILLFLVLMYPKFMGRLAVIAVVAMIVVGPILLQAGYLDRARNRLTSEEADNSALGRLPVYLAAIRMFSEKPVFGWGYDNFDRFDRKYQSRVGNLVNPDEKDLTAHNVYLTMLAEQGLLGLGTYLLPTVVLIWRSRKVAPFLSDKGVLNKNLFYSLWLVILAFFVVQSFSPMVVVFGLGLNWITYGLIANVIYIYET